MKPKTVSLETAKALQEAGIEVESYFVHVYNTIVKRSNVYVASMEISEKVRSSFILVKYPAPQFEELAERLPTSLQRQPVFKTSYNPTLAFYHREREVDCSYDFAEEICYLEAFHIETADTPSDAAAAMLIWLKENGHLEDK